MPDLRSPRPLDLTGYGDNQGKPAAKVLHAGDEFAGQPYLAIDENGFALVADAKKVLTLGPDFGINLSGLIHLAATPEQVSFAGGYWRINPLVLSGIPSTTPTPLPWLVPAVPRLLASSGDLSSVASGLTDKLTF
jgi:hypothetical protein